MSKDAKVGVKPNEVGTFFQMSPELHLIILKDLFEHTIPTHLSEQAILYQALQFFVENPLMDAYHAVWMEGETQVGAITIQHDGKVYVTRNDDNGKIISEKRASLQSIATEMFALAQEKSATILENVAENFQQYLPSRPEKS